MLLRDIKAGETYAYIPGYGELTRKDNAYCGNLPSANAVVVEKKEKRLVEIRRDSCGRPKMQNQTFLVCKVVKIAPTDILAGDLDIVLDKHPDLVTETEDIKPLDLVWPWEMEIEQARENAEVLRQVDNRMAYLDGVSFRVMRHLFNQDRTFYELIKERLVAVGSSHLAKVCLSRNTHTGGLKQTIYDILKGDKKVVPMLDTQIDVGCTLGDPYRNHRNLTCHWKREIRVTYDTKLHELFRSRFPEEFAAYDAAVERKENSTEGWQERTRLRDLAQAEWNKIVQKIQALSVEEKLAFLDSELVAFGKEVAKKAGTKIAKFNPKKNWVAWAQDAEESAKEVHDGSNKL